MSEPWMKFYPADWRSDPRLRMCGMAARGLWIEMIALMHEAVPYGHLLVSGQSPTDAQLAVLAGAPPDQISELIGELESAGVFSRTREGVIYSRKMTRTAKKTAIARKNGKNGGNPTLRKQSKISASDNQIPTDRVNTQKPETRNQKEIEPNTHHPEPACAPGEKSTYDRLIEAASARGRCHERLSFGFSAIADLIAKGYDLDRDVLPIVRDHASPDIRSWNFFVPIIISAASKRRQIPEAPKAPAFDWRKALEVYREGTWADGWGPKPGERGCRVPTGLLAEFGYERAA